MPFQHEYHLLLWLLEKACKFDAYLVCQLVKLRVLLLNKLHQLAHLSLEVVKTLTDQYPLLELVKNLVNCRFINYGREGLLMRPLFPI